MVLIASLAPKRAALYLARRPNCMGMIRSIWAERPGALCAGTLVLACLFFSANAEGGNDTVAAPTANAENCAQCS